jgi:two-component system chemotaxis response regulator CheY
MTLDIGQDYGKIVLIHTLTGSILGNYSVFTTKEKVKFVTFCTESLVAVANEHNIKILDIVQKKVILKNEQSHTIIAIAGSTDVLMFANKKREIQGIRFMRKHKEEFLLHKADDDIKSLTFSVNKQVLYALFSSGIALYEANVKGHIAPINVFFERGTSFFPVGEDQLLVAHGNGVVKLLSDIKAIDNTIKELLAEQSFEETVDSSKMVRHDNTIRFLTVDDSATMRMIIKNSIVNNFEDVEVYEAEDGVGAISTLEQRGDIDIMFLDWNMPIMNGPEVVKSIYKHKTRHGGVKIIMATTEASKEKVRSMVSKGVKGYLVKPFRAESITPLVEKMIEGIKKERT